MVNADSKRLRSISSWDDRAVNALVYTVLTLIAIFMLYPFINLVSVAFSPYEEYLKNPLMIFPKKLSFEAFGMVFSSKMLWRCYLNTIVITLAGTFLTLIMTILMAYPLSKSFLRGKAVVTGLMVFTMLFSGGLIPMFLLIKDLHMYDSLWALIIPSIFTPYYIILTMNFFRAMPASLEEAAFIDGAGDGSTLLKIVIPLSGPIISSIALFAAVSYWNSYFSAIVYLKDRMKWPLQLLLREILLAADNMALSAEGNAAEINYNAVPTVSIRYACVVVVMLPIMCIYPFLQKNFAKGVMLGAVKG